jgi:hypothetical protein
MIQLADGNIFLDLAAECIKEGAVFVVPYVFPRIIPLHQVAADKVEQCETALCSAQFEFVGMFPEQRVNQVLVDTREGGVPESLLAIILSHIFLPAFHFILNVSGIGVIYLENERIEMILHFGNGG